MAPPHVGHHASRRSPRVQYGPNEGFRRRLEPAPQRNRYLVDAAAARQGRTGAVTDGGLQHDHGHTTGAPVLTVPTKVQSGFSSRTATHGSTTTRWVTRFGGAATITASATSTRDLSAEVLGHMRPLEGVVCPTTSVPGHSDGRDVPIRPHMPEIFGLLALAVLRAGRPIPLHRGPAERTGTHCVMYAS